MTSGPGRRSEPGECGPLLVLAAPFSSRGRAVGHHDLDDTEILTIAT